MSDEPPEQQAVQLPFEEELDPSIEGEPEIEAAARKAISVVALTATDWTAETILSQLARGNIELNPRFQRRDAWTPIRKARFIESLFLGLPIPQLVLAEHPGRRGTYLVLDGKQRLLSLRQFASTEDDAFRPLVLNHLELRSDLNGKTLAMIEADESLTDDLNAFQNQTIRTVVVRNWPDDAFLYLVFLRLNTGSLPLSPQELRQALLPGPFTDYLDDASSASPGLQSALQINGPDFRMRDVELLLRFLAFDFFLSEYTGNLKLFLDTTCERLNKSWASDEEAIADRVSACEAAIEATQDVFGTNHAFQRWSGERYEGRFNRAIFDVMVFFFKDPQIRSAATGKKAEVVESFKRLCEQDPDFNRYVQTTTKSTEATFSRFGKWRERLSEALGMEIPQP